MTARNIQLPGTDGPAADPLALDQQVCFALVVAARSVVALYRPVLERLGLTHPQYLVMLALWQHAPLSVKRLGQLLQLDPRHAVAPAQAAGGGGADHPAAGRG